MVRKALSVTRNEFVSLIHKPKLLLIIVSIVFMIDSVAKPMKDLSMELGYQLNIAEPFIFITSKGINIVIIPLIFIAILSDFPSAENSGYFSLIRNGRVSWLIGETLFAVLSSVIYIFIINYLIFNIFPNNIIFNTIFFILNTTNIVRRCVND